MAIEYILRIPVARQPRDNGGFNMMIQHLAYENSPPTVSKKRLREIGGS